MVVCMGNEYNRSVGFRNFIIDIFFKCFIKFFCAEFRCNFSCETAVKTGISIAFCAVRRSPNKIRKLFFIADTSAEISAFYTKSCENLRHLGYMTENIISITVFHSIGIPFFGNFFAKQKVSYQTFSRNQKFIGHYIPRTYSDSALIY